MRERARSALILLAAALWTVAGLSLPVILLPGLGRPDLDELVLALGCIVFGLAFSRARLTFQRGSQELSVAPDSGFHVLAAVVLAPPLAALVGGLAVLDTIRNSGTRLERCYLAATGALATGAAAVVAHELVGVGEPSAREVLLAAFAAASTRAVLALAGTLLLAESRAAGGALAVVRGVPLPTLTLLEVALPTILVAAAAPFLGEPIVAIAIVIAGQLLTWRLLIAQHQLFRGSHVTGALLDTFRRYVPQHVATQILDGNDSAASATGGQQREVTVMFLDIRDFTTWSERTEPAEVLAELNHLLGELAESILATDGTIDKFTGDGLMAFWNAPADQPDHAQRAVQTLPRLLMRVHEFNLRRATRRSDPLEIGIGIATGPAMVGNIGHRDRLAYTAIGDTVNLAARLEKATRELDVPALIDEGTFLELPMSLQRQLMRLESISVKGRSERVRLYAPVALLRHRERRAA